MSTTQQTKTELIYDGRERDMPRYALKDESGNVKCVLHCKFCKRSIYQWMKAHSQQWGLCADWKQADAAKSAHLAECEAFKPYASAWSGRGWSNDTVEAQGMQYLHVDIFHWIKRADGGHKCNAKCMSACGPSCECRCKGENHGGR